MRVLLQYFAVGMAGFLGAIARVALGSLFGRLSIRFPIGTLFINVTGSFILGWFLTYATERRNISDTMRLAIGAGFVGAYTTFSTLMFDTTRLADDGARLQAVSNLFFSLLLGLLAVRFGIILARRM